jgi:hypothetical protein
MVDGQHKLSRRALLGAVCAAPLVRHPGLGSHQSTTLMGSLDPGSMNAAGHQARASVFMDSGFRRNDEFAAEWMRALAGFAAAEAALVAAAGASDEIYDPLGTRHEAALRRLLRTPAPDTAALARKLEFALDERSGEFFGDEAAMKAIKRDARRLAAWAD